MCLDTLQLSFNTKAVDFWVDSQDTATQLQITETLARHSDFPFHCLKPFAGGQEPCDRDCSAWPTGPWSSLFEVTTLGKQRSIMVCLMVCLFASREASAATRQKAEEAAERMLMQHARFKPLEDSAVAA